MSKNKTKTTNKKKQEGVPTTTKVASLVILAIMVLSIVGFALSMSGGQQTSHGDQSQVTIPLTEGAFQKPNTGETYWGAIVKGEQFVFLNGIDGFQELSEIENLANQINNKQTINIQLASNYSNADSLYLIEEKLLPSFEIEVSRIAQNQTCNENTIIFSNEQIENECLQFIAPQGEETYYAEALSYFMITKLSQ